MITSYPQKTNHGETRILREEDEPGLTRHWETNEDRMGYYYSILKLRDNLLGVSVGPQLAPLFSSLSH